MAGRDEVPLSGGRMTDGVVRVGGTVRRPASPASRFVERLLHHLHREGFDGCPRHLGRDDRGRDTLSFVEGQVPARWRRFDDDQVDAAARLLRRMHDATRGLAAPLGGEVICHHDPGPNNTVFRDGRPVAFIDFDFAAPGHPVEDLGYMAWGWCVSSRPDRGPVTGQARQVRILADGYGLAAADRSRLVPAIEDRLRRNVGFWLALRDAPRTVPSRRGRAGEVVAWTRREAAYLAAHRDTFTAALA